ncbi:MAG: hypothetical protein U5J63_09180 [Fodinibius sp.]|nr:hypothetical protein [Fodinibius sp.]
MNVFLDCNRCDRSYIRQEITFINYVRDKEDSQVHLIITRQRTGSGGTEYTLRFVGTPSSIEETTKRTYTSANSDTEDEERRGLTKEIKLGLLPYVIKTDIGNNLTINYEQSNEQQQTTKEDKWNSWIFELNGNSYFNGEQSSSRLYLSFGASADRITKDWKIETNYNYDFNRRTFTELDSLENEQTSIYTTQGQQFNSSIIKSITDHWSVGIFGEAYSSSRNNIDYAFTASPALEFNIYPYEEYAEHEISFRYLILTGYYDYDKITIFNKKSELLFRQRLRARIDFTQPWGEIEGRANASAYMHDLSRNRLDINLEFDFRIFRGLSFNISGRYALINDQLAIPKGNISDAEQLLNLRQQSTSYSYSGSVGIEYSFGSIYNNVVNSRF